MAIKFNPATTTVDEDKKVLTPAGNVIYTPPVPETSINLEFTPDYEYDLDQIIFDIRRDNPAEALIMKVNTEAVLGERLVAIVLNQIFSDYNTQNPTLIPNFNIIFNTALQTAFDSLTDAQRSSFLEGAMTLDDSFKSRVVAEDIDNALGTRLTGFTQIVWQNTSADETDEDDVTRISQYINKIEKVQLNGTDLSIVEKTVDVRTHSAINQITESTNFVLNDINKMVQCLNDDPIEITIPTDLDLEFPMFAEIKVIQYGEGSVSIVGDVTINSKSNLNSISEKYGLITAKKVGPDEWILFGDLA